MDTEMVKAMSRHLEKLGGYETSDPTTHPEGILHRCPEAGPQMGAEAGTGGWKTGTTRVSVRKEAGENTELRSTSHKANVATKMHRNHHQSAEGPQVSLTLCPPLTVQKYTGIRNNSGGRWALRLRTRE